MNDYTASLLGLPMDDYERDRRLKLDALRAAHVEPYGSARPDMPDHKKWGHSANTIAFVRKHADQPTITDNVDENARVRVTGRIVLKRDMGKLSFLTIRDDTGDIQIGLSKQRLDERGWTTRNNLDLGDIIFVQGPLGYTKTKELTVWAILLEMGAKSLVPPPAKQFTSETGESEGGLQDKELRYRERYVDLWANPEVMKVMRQRSEIVWFIRSFLQDVGYVEVETPIMQPIYGGAAAKPFTTHHNALDLNLYLRIAPELYLKRLLVGGMRAVFEIGKNFRNEGISPRHNPEFTVMEAYAAWGDYETMMNLTERMIIFVQQSMGMRVSDTFRRVRMEQLVADWGVGEDMPPANALTPEVIHAIYEENVEKTIMEPTFVTHLPASKVPLAKESEKFPGYADCFEFVWRGMEIGPGYTEQNNPDIQKTVFLAQREKQLMAHLNGTDYTGPDPIDEDFIHALMVGMPPAGGLGLGIDRLVTVLLDQPSVKDVILFPLMKPQ